MIGQIRAQNFKSWRDTGELTLAPLTGLFGTNSSGKTSILQILLMLKQTVESPDRRRVLHFGDERTPVDLGTFYDIAHEHETGMPLDLALTWTLGKRLKISNPNPEARGTLFDLDALTFNTLIRQNPELNRLWTERFTYAFGDQQFGMQRSDDEPGQRKQKYDLISVGYDSRRLRGRAWPLPAPVKCYGFPDEATTYYQNTGFLSDFVLAFEDLFSRIFYLGPLREYPKRTYVWAGESPVDVGRRGELAVPALLASRARGRVISPGYKRRRRTVEERVGEWMQEMEIIDSFSLRPIAEHRKDYELRVTTRRGGPEVPITDVGFGVSQVLPVLVLCYYVPEGSVILLEQPEIHLHPFVQAKLADVLIDAVQHRGVQIVVESHSEHLLARLQRRIAEEKIAPEKTALYFCRLEQGESQIERLNLTLFGEITNWPDGFFGDEMGDRLAMAKAAMQRASVG